MSAPSGEVSEVWPVWHDFVDNWRATDAHWIRDRVVNLFDNAGARSTALTGQTLVPGGLSFLQDVFSLEFYKGGDPALAASWESVRYPNLSVTQATNQVLLRYVSTAGAIAGSGVILDNTGTASIEKLNAGLGTMLANINGITLHTGAVGNRTVLMATDATALTIDSPVKLASTLAVTGALTAPSVALTGAATAATVTATGQVQGATVVATGQSSGASGLFGSIALLSNKSGWASLQHNSASSGTQYGFFADANGNTSVNGGANAVNGQLNVANGMTVAGYTRLQGGAEISPPGKTATAIAGLIVVGGRGPGSGDNYPDGTIWIQV